MTKEDLGDMEDIQESNQNGNNNGINEFKKYYKISEIQNQYMFDDGEENETQKENEKQEEVKEQEQQKIEDNKPNEENKVENKENESIDNKKTFLYKFLKDEYYDMKKEIKDILFKNFYESYVTYCMLNSPNMSEVLLNDNEFLSIIKSICTTYTKERFKNVKTKRPYDNDKITISFERLTKILKDSNLITDEKEIKKDNNEDKDNNKDSDEDNDNDECNEEDSKESTIEIQSAKKPKINKKYNTTDEFNRMILEIDNEIFFMKIEIIFSFVFCILKNL
jgi:hypothetical protein